MANLKISNKFISYEVKNNGMHVKIPMSRRSPSEKKLFYKIIGLFVFLSGASVFLSFSFFQGQNEYGVSLVFLGFLTAVFFGLFHKAALCAIGKEILMIENNLVRFSHDFKLFRTWARDFLLEEMKNIRFSDIKNRSFSYSEGRNAANKVLCGKHAGKIVFDYEGHVFRFGICVSEEEARELIGNLQAFDPSESETKNV